MTNQEKIKGAIRCPVCKKEKVIAYEGASGKAYRVYDSQGVSTTLIGNAGGMGAKTGLYFIDQSKVGRYISHGTVRWICSSYKRKGQAKCPGVRIPDEIIKGWNLPDGKIYIMGKEDKNGEKHYSYTSESAL